MHESAELHERLARSCSPAVAQYAVSMAYRIRFYMRMNAREAMHVIELRTSPQGHPAYRRICRDMWKLIKEVAGHEAIADAMTFVNRSESPWKGSRPNGRTRSHKAGSSWRTDRQGHAPGPRLQPSSHSCSSERARPSSCSLIRCATTLSLAMSLSVATSPSYRRSTMCSGRRIPARNAATI